MKKFELFLLCALVFALAACSNSKQQIVQDDAVPDDTTVDDGTVVQDDGPVPTDGIAGDELLTDGDAVNDDDSVTDELVTDDIATDEDLAEGDPEPAEGDDIATDEDGLASDDDTTAPLACNGILTCQNDCGNDSTCRDACVAAGSTEGQEEYDVLLTCVETNCATECSISDQECQTCATTACAAELNDCYIDENAPVYGTIAVNATFNYIYDGDSDIQTQIQANQTGLVMSSVFTGTYAVDKPIPPTASGATTLSLALHQAASGSNPATIRVVTRVALSNGTIVNPMVQLRFPSDVIVPGSVSTDAAQQGTAVVALLNSTGPNTYCLLAYSFGGSVTVTAATNTNQVSGGSLAFNGSGIPVYHPTETPIGDISGNLGSLSACPKE